MIVVNLKRSMERLLHDIPLGMTDEDLLDHVRTGTAGDWNGISTDALERYGQYIVGVHGDRIASVYRIEGIASTQESGRVRFDVSDAVELADVIGQPVPGGAWRRGEARPVRYLDTDAFMRHFDTGPAHDRLDEHEVSRRIVEYVREQATSAAASPTTSAATASDLLAQVAVELDPRGGVRVTVPLGTKVTVVQAGS